MDQPTTRPVPDLGADLSELTVPELHAYIQRLRAYIRGLQDYTTALQAQVTELERRDFLAATHRA